MPLSVLMRSASPLRWFNHYCSTSEAVVVTPCTTIGRCADQ
ncbi:hypothetical protein [Porphyromonas sp.]